jgi:predicted AAA+ superfamily ATPase
MILTDNALCAFLYQQKRSPVLKRNLHFPTHSLGLASLPRTSLISEIYRILDRQIKTEETGPYNVYLYGMKASGKTIILNNLAKKFQDEGYIVYFFQDAKELDQFSQITDLLPTETKVAIIVDEVRSCPDTSCWTYY